jgi:hypothetical protein
MKKLKQILIKKVKQQDTPPPATRNQNFHDSRVNSSGGMTEEQVRQATISLGSM